MKSRIAPVVELAAVRVIEERPEPMRVPRLFGPRTLSARFDVSRMCIYRLHKAGKLRGVRVAGVLRFLESDVLDFLRAEGVPVEDSK